MNIKKEAILTTVRQHQAAPLAFRELMFLFGIDKARRSPFKDLVDRLIDEGELVKLKGNRISIATKVDAIAGRLTTNRAGFGFVVPEKGGEDIFIPARYLRENFHGDRVEVRVTATKEGGRREGRIVRTLERALKRVVGRYVGDQKEGRVVSDEPRITQDIFIPQAGGGGAGNGQMVVAEITAYPASGRHATGKVVEVLGWPDEPEVEILTIIRKYDLPYEFPEEVLVAARIVPRAVPAADLDGRVDLRARLTVTIDGETARDFDDAVSVRREDHDRIRLWVSIADVSHYVKEESTLDTEAFLRGTSVYFPDRCIPMLPEELSNGICSLNPDVERLTMTAELLIDRAGMVLESSFYPSVIRSAARLTYTEVKKIVVDRDPETVAARSGLVADLTLMEELALRLTEKRRSRGSIDFDLPEPQIILDLAGGILAIIRAERNLAHRIIEEFMLAANEAVALFIEGRLIPSLYRIHEHPDLVKLGDFKEFVKSFGHDFRMDEDAVAPGEFQRLLDAVIGRPEERLINEVLLRCMKQARYSAENIGHFGLAAPSYTHFTSPIRRYPDLVIHRILKMVIAGKPAVRTIERLEATLPEIAAQSSRRERIAMEAEREIVELKKMQFMLDKVGEEYGGFITGVTTSGFFVELAELFVEGMVRLASLPDDFYHYHEKQHLLMGEGSRTVYRLGDRVRVRVGSVSLARKEIDFGLVGRPEPGLAVASGEEYPRIPVKGKPVSGQRRGGRDGQAAPRPGEKGAGGGPGRGKKGGAGEKEGTGSRRRR